MRQKLDNLLGIKVAHIAREDEAAAGRIRERMDALQDEICASGITGNEAAETCWRAALELLSGFGR